MKMKKLALFCSEFEPDTMISNEDLKKNYDGDWVEFMKNIFKEEGIGLFENFELIDILDEDFRIGDDG